MKKLFMIVFTLLISFTSVYGEDGNVTYDGNAQDFIFSPGSTYSPTDLFPNFKGVMPGDCLEQKIRVRNEASKSVDVKIYIRSLGAKDNYVDFLSQLKLSVESESGNLFNANADQKAQLTDWICLGTFKSGEEVDLNVVLEVPVELDGKYMNEIGYLDWEFMVEEFPIEEPPHTQTGDTANINLWICLATSSILLMVFLKGRKEEESKA